MNAHPQLTPKQMTALKKLEMAFIIVWGLIIGLFLAYSFIQHNRGDIPYSTTAEIQGFSICDAKQSPSEGPVSLTVCGHLVTNGRAGLEIIVYGMPGEHLVGQNAANDEFRNGDFYRTIQLDNSENYTHYKVVVYLYKNLIASTEFKAKH